MKIRDISIDGFGVWSGLRLAGLEDGINVFYGPNEAGKTTLMQFLRAILYGFSPDRRARYLPPASGGRPGGEIAVASAEGIVTVRRYAADESRQAANASIGRLELAVGQEVVRDDRLLARLLGQVDEAVYRNVFAIGLREIQELGALGDTDAAQWLYKLAAGADRVSLVDVLTELAKARERLIASGQAPATITQLLAERDKLRRETHSQAAVRRYVELVLISRELAERIEACETAARADEKESRLIEIAAAIHEKWHARAGLEKELAAVHSVPRLEPGELAEFAALRSTIDRSRTRAKRLARLLAKKRRAIDSLALDQALRGAARESKPCSMRSSGRRRSISSELRWPRRSRPWSTSGPNCAPGTGLIPQPRSRIRATQAARPGGSSSRSGAHSRGPAAAHASREGM